MNEKPADRPIWMPLPAISSNLTMLGRALATQLDAISDRMSLALIEGIPGLPREEHMRDLLRASVRGNMETASRIYLGKLTLEAIQAPPAALEYARRLAQQEASPSALTRAYRWGQFMTMEWAMGEFAQLGDAVAELQSVRELNALNFWYVDHLSEVVLAEYQAERERWLSHRGTVRAEMLRNLLDGTAFDLAAAEHTLAYRLRGNHVAAVIWIDDDRAGPADLAGLEAATQELAEAAGAAGQSLFWSQNPTTAWVWVPWDADRHADLAALRAAMAKVGPRVRIALGGQGQGIAGFRQSHQDALLAEQVARIAADAAPVLISAADPGVRVAALLATDLDGVRRLVATTLGGLAADTASAAALRETLRVYLAEGGSHTAAADRLHVHKNTVGYRLGKAAELCGRSLDANRVDLELALVACQWLGPTVLSS